jgi:hypothetical protein
MWELSIKTAMIKNKLQKAPQEKILGSYCLIIYPPLHGNYTYYSLSFFLKAIAPVTAESARIPATAPTPASPVLGESVFLAVVVAFFVVVAFLVVVALVVETVVVVVVAASVVVTVVAVVVAADSSSATNV